MSDFHIETFDSIAFENTIDDASNTGSRDKAFSIRQKMATNAKNWSNDSQKYLAQRNYVDGVRETFRLIRDAVDSFKKLRSTQDHNGIVEAVERFNIQYYIERQLGYIGGMTEQFWDEFSHNKDRLSYKFGSRCFPTGDQRWSESFNDESKTAAPAETMNNRTDDQRRKEAAELQRATMDRIAKMYDINDVHLKNFMDRNYVDGDVGGLFAPLDPNQYYDLISLSEVEYLFQTCYEEKLYGTMMLFWCHFVSSKQFVHLILNSETILNLMFNPNIYSYDMLVNNKLKTITQNPFLDEKYREIINHYLFYGLYILCREEYHVKTKAVDNLRYILDIRAVSKLPTFDGPLSANPYMSVTLSEKYLYSQETAAENRVIRPIRAAAKWRGLYGLESFRQRFSVFTGGVLENVDFDRLYFTGSLIAACSIKNPLERKFGIEFTDDDTRAVAYWNNVRRNLTDYFNEYYPGKGVLNMDGLTNVQLAEIEEGLTDIDCIIDAIEDSEFDRLCVRLYETIKRNLLLTSKKTLNREDLNITRIDTGQSYKYHIDGKLLVRSFELFRVYELRPAGCVSRFHFAPVRGYYDGTTVRILASMLNSAYTGLCTDYKWFSSSNKPQTLICKYYLRGFYCLLNGDEQRDLRQFMADNPAWSLIDELPKPPTSSEEADLFDDPGKTRSTSVSIMDPIFNPRASRVGTFHEMKHLRDAPNLKYVQDADITNLLVPKPTSSQFGIDLEFRYPAGHVKPVNLWHVTPYARDLARSKKYASII